MDISIFYFIWILFKTRNILKTMRYIFDKYKVDTFEIKILWKIIKFTKEKDLCEACLSMESRTTWLSRYLNEYYYYPYALINLDIINPLYYTIHSCLVKSFNTNIFKNITIRQIIHYFPIYLFGKSYDRLKFNKLCYCIKKNKINSINKILEYLIKKSINDETTIIYKFNKKLHDYLNDEQLINNIIIDNIYLILYHFYQILELKLKYEINQIKYTDEIYEVSLNDLNMNYLCVRQLPFTNDYVFMDLRDAKLFFSYGIKKCLFSDVIINDIQI
jgi:hypothetical protein